MKLSLNTRSSNPDWNGHMDCAVVDVTDRYHNGRGVSVMREAVLKHSSTTVETVDIENRATSRTVRQSQPTEAARMNPAVHPLAASREAEANAKAWIRNARDVVHMSTFRITKWVEPPQPPHRETVKTYTDLVEWLEYHKIDAAHAVHLASETVGVLYRDIETQRLNAPDGSTWPARPGADTIEMLSLLYERFTPDEKADRHALSIDEP